MLLSMDRNLRLAPVGSVLMTLLVATLLGVFAALTTGVSPAQAHDELLSSSPADGAVLDAAPAAIVLTFAAAPLQDTTKMVATDSTGAQYPLTTVTKGPKATAAWPAEATAGTYTVAWRNVGSDGHPLSGTFSFSFTSGTATSATATPTATVVTPGTPIATTGPLPTTAPTGVGGSVWLLPTVIAVLVLVAAIFGLRASRQRKKNDRPNT